MVITMAQSPMRAQVRFSASSWPLPRKTWLCGSIHGALVPANFDRLAGWGCDAGKVSRASTT
jgi:hypothetical protein